MSDFAFTYGQFLLAAFISTALLGVTCIQTLIYFVKYIHSDPWHLKYLVAEIFFLDIVHESICVSIVWQIFIPRFGDLENVSSLPAQYVVEPITLNLVLTTTHAFFGWRIWYLYDRRWFFAAVVIPLMLVQAVGFLILVTGLVTVAVMLHRPSFYMLTTPGMINLLFVIYGINAAIDAIIAITMCTLLWQGRTGLQSGDRMIFRLISAAVSTGICTVLVSLSIVVTASVWRQGFIQAIGVFSLCPVSSNAVLANLNARKYIGRRSTVDISVGSSIRFHSPATTNRAHPVEPKLWVQTASRP